MLQINRFDIKTGKSIQESLEGGQQPAVKQAEHAYLEHWLSTNGIEAQFSVAKFYESVNDTDRQRLESEGKHLVFTSGSDGYFTDRATAQLMTFGSEAVEPIYAGDRDSPHNMVAYGGLISSDGVASTTIQSARILVIDDERRTHDDTSLRDKNGRPVTAREIAALYDKMGDGTMLVSDRTMRSLQTPEEREAIALKAAEKSGVSGDFSKLFQEMPAADTAVAAGDRQEEALARRSVVQFRAASPDLPGIAKGTMASSYWCDRLGVDAIISSNDIKGDDGRLAAPGMKEVSSFWINRKAIAQYGQQSVGPQVKYTIPEATRLEINPKVHVQAEELAQVTGDFAALSQRYVEHKEKERSRPYQELEDDTLQATRPDWLYDTLSADKYGQLTGQAKVVDGLSRYVRGEWLRLATNGTSVPSAMAQHHSQLKPWEVCNKDLPHGAIVAYYRSPFPNVGAAAIAINSTEIIREQDREAFSKQGVAYLPPWTAKNVAITDFDGDMNGFFVGYQATGPDLPQQIRAELAAVEVLPPNQQYEAGRALFERMIQQLEQGQENRITPDEHPLAVKEFAEQNAPKVRPPEVIKQTKEKHPWTERKSHAAATWRAWEITADNPTGKVANAGMSLQALALEMKYAPAEKKEALLEQVSGHFTELLASVDAGKVSIPDDDWLTFQGFSPSYRERIEAIAGSSSEVATYEEPQQRHIATEVHLQRASNLFSEVANGPNAVNLQTAVDMAKSAKGIDGELHKFAVALQYKQDVFRQNKNNPEVYVGGKKMPTNTEEPIAWNVQSVNKRYSDAQMEERLHQEYQAVFPKTDNEQQKEQAKAIVQNYNGLMRKAVTSKSRQQQRRAEDQKPTLRVMVSDGRTITLQNIEDPQGKLPLWRAEGPQPSWTIRIKQDPEANQQRQFPAQLIFVDSQGAVQAERVGYVSPESVLQHNLAQRLKQPDKKARISKPSVTMQVPWAQQNDTDLLFEETNRYIELAIAPPEGKESAAHRQEMAIALWRQSDGRHIVMKQFPDILSDRLAQVPEIQIGRLQVSAAASQRLIEQSPHTIQFGKHSFMTKAGDSVTLPSVSVMQPDGRQLLIGAVAARSIALPEGATYMAAFSKNPGSDHVIDMQVMDLPIVEQTQAEAAAFSEGRSHLTFDYEPHAAYGIREGDIVVTQGQDSGSVALRVGGQHRIDAQLAAKAGAAQRWAAVERSSPAVLFEQLAAARSEGKQLWGLNVEPLGTYVKGQITPFPGAEQSQQMLNHQPEPAPASVSQEPQAKPPSLQLYERYSSQDSGVLSAIAAGNPQLQQRLDSAVAERAIADGHPIEAVQQAIARYSPEAQRSGQPDDYAKNVVTQVDHNTAKPTHSPSKKRTQTQSRNLPKRAKAKDNGMGY